MTTVANIYTYRGSMDDAVFVGRPSRYGNPWKVGKHGTRAEVIAYFRTWWLSPINQPVRAQALVELKGKVLLCFCAPAACHAQVIADWLNEQVAA